MSRTLRLALVLLLAPACKAEDPGIDSGLSPEKELGALSPGENQQFCEASFDYEQSEIGEQALHELHCLTEAVTTTTDATACQKAFDICMVDSKTVPTSAECITYGAGSGCKATVADHNACVESIIAAKATAAAGSSCTNAKAVLDFNTRYLANDPPFDPACTRIDDMCPFE